jgi:hypothetical protein
LNVNCARTGLVDGEINFGDAGLFMIAITASMSSASERFVSRNGSNRRSQDPGIIRLWVVGRNADED